MPARKCLPLKRCLVLNIVAAKKSRIMREDDTCHSLRKHLWKSSCSCMRGGCSRPRPQQGWVDESVRFECTDWSHHPVCWLADGPVLREDQCPPVFARCCARGRAHRLHRVILTRNANRGRFWPGHIPHAVHRLQKRRAEGPGYGPSANDIHRVSVAKPLNSLIPAPA